MQAESGSRSWVSDGWRTPLQESPGSFSECCFNSARSRVTLGQQTPRAQTLRSWREWMCTSLRQLLITPKRSKNGESHLRDGWSGGVMCEYLKPFPPAAWVMKDLRDLIDRAEHLFDLFPTCRQFPTELPVFLGLIVEINKYTETALRVTLTAFDPCGPLSFLRQVSYSRCLCRLQSSH